MHRRKIHWSEVKAAVLEVLKDNFSDAVTINETEAGVLIQGSRPVVIKARIHKLMIDSKLMRGTLIQYNDCVEYRPTGAIKVYDLYTRIRE